MDMTQKLMLRPAEAAEAIGVSRSKLYEMIAAKEIPSIVVSGCTRVPVEALQAWITEEIQKAAKAAAIER
jgi:excisionase family DNA binding protein